MEYSGERHVPGATDWDDQTEHLSRYHACVEAVRGLRVLDAACGAGYGTDLLGHSALEATGLDLSQAAVEHASAQYPACRFVVGSIAQLPFEDESFDAVISFETLEHVDSTTQQTFLAEIKRVLTPGGFLIMSTPDKHWATDVPGTVNEHHVHELYEADFEKLVQGHFSNVAVYYQNLWVYSEVLRRGEPRSDRMITGQPSYGQNLVAVCSDAAPLPDIAYLVRTPHGYREVVRDLSARIHSTMSWRLTAPLRWLKARLRGQ